MKEEDGSRLPVAMSPLAKRQRPNPSAKNTRAITLKEVTGKKSHHILSLLR